MIIECGDYIFTGDFHSQEMEELDVMTYQAVESTCTGALDVLERFSGKY